MDIEPLSYSPVKITEALRMLGSAARKTPDFTVWAVAFRALAYYDRRQTISILLKQLSKGNDVKSDPKKKEITGAQSLVLTEACLECAQPLTVMESLLESVDIRKCSPLTPEITYLWRQWLSAEISWWKEEHTNGPNAFETRLTTLLQRPAPQLDPYMTTERQRLISRALLFCARSAIARRDCGKALEWLTRAGDIQADTGGLSPGLWELDYLKAMAAWRRGEPLEARSYFEKCLSLNPFQSRVRFESDLLRFLQEPSSMEDSAPRYPSLSLPGVPDALASNAAALLKQGRGDDARQYLEQMERPPTAYSLLLVWPEALKLRIRQGKQLHACIAENQKKWRTAMHLWDAAPRTAEPSSSRLTHRAHQLYLLGKHLQQTGGTMETEDADRENKKLHIHFHKELGKLAVRTLTGEAMFYRGLAAEKSMPQRAVADFRALLRQPKWLEKSRTHAPARLLYIGDHLFKAGLHNDAYKAYRCIDQDSHHGAAQRRLLGDLVLRFPPDPAAVDSILKGANPDEHLQGQDNPPRDFVSEAGKGGLILSDQWKAFLYLSQSIQIALAGDFETAENIRRRAMETLTPGSSKENKNDENI